MSKRSYFLSFADEQKARAAQKALQEHGQVALSEEEDDHQRLYRLTLTTDSVRASPTPYDIDRIALRFGGRLDETRAS
jgi:hypothetical protein